jgi:hypothetical protein
MRGFAAEQIPNSAVTSGSTTELAAYGSLKIQLSNDMFLIVLHQELRKLIRRS